MTLREIARDVNMSPEQLAERLNLTDDADPNERIGPLLRRHGLRMSDLRSAIGDEVNFSDDRFRASPR